MMNLGNLLWLALFVSCQAFSSPSSSSVSSPVVASSSSSTALQAQSSRADFLQVTTAGLVAMASFGAAPAWAGVDPALKGTKKDPAYEACISKCMYECTKPKVEEQKSRQECLPDCKKQCATTKEQLLKGTPINKA
eukprot:scaffold38350_cov153-Amphora_coffeaeformis.AAC.1